MVAMLVQLDPTCINILSHKSLAYTVFVCIPTLWAAPRIRTVVLAAQQPLKRTTAKLLANISTVGLWAASNSSMHCTSCSICFSE
jgi:hypothetical protein